MPIAELVSRYYFRVRHFGLDGIPPDQAIFVGNHSGGLTTPDSAMTAHAIWSRFGADYPAYAMIHPSIFLFEALAKPLVRLGGLAATARMAHRALRSGASLLIYPGGGDEAYRSFANRNIVDLRGRSAYVRLAMEYGVPIVPVVALGGHNTLLVLNDGEAIAKRLGLDRLGIPRVPIVLSLPFGVTAGFHHSIPPPVRIDIAFGKPIRLEGFAPKAARSAETVAACHDHIQRRMQAMLDALLAGRRKALRSKPVASVP
jgi:1-acyl-sn-glycerol-3-phosphate acyltransferase